MRSEMEFGQKGFAMRHSIAAFALVRRTAPGGVTEWLANWNANWHALNLVGGHKRPDESFRDCCTREVAEELGLVEGADFAVAPLPAAHLEYVAMSQAAGVETAYVIELFPADLRGETAFRRLAAD